MPTPIFDPATLAELSDYINEKLNRDENDLIVVEQHHAIEMGLLKFIAASLPFKATTTGPSYNWPLPQGVLLEMVMLSSASTQVIQIGTTPGGNDIMADIVVPSNEPIIQQLFKVYPSTAKTIYISGITAGLTIYFYKR